MSEVGTASDFSKGPDADIARIRMQPPNGPWGHPPPPGGQHPPPPPGQPWLPHGGPPRNAQQQWPNRPAGFQGPPPQAQQWPDSPASPRRGGASEAGPQGGRRAWGRPAPPGGPVQAPP